MIHALIAPIVGLIGSVIDKAIPDKAQAAELKANITLEAMKADSAELKSATDIIIAEAQGGWLQRNWRPITALFFTGLVGAHWLGFTPENLSQETVNRLLDIVLAMISGYTVMRSGEKMMKTWKEK